MTAAARDPIVATDQKRLYEEILQRAFRYAERLVSREQAFEIAHDVAVEMLRRPPERLSGTMLYLRVTSRLRNLWRANQRRAACSTSAFAAAARVVVHGSRCGGSTATGVPVCSWRCCAPKSCSTRHDVCRSPFLS